MKAFLLILLFAGISFSQTQTVTLNGFERFASDTVGSAQNGAKDTLSKQLWGRKPTTKAITDSLRSYFSVSIWATDSVYISTRSDFYQPILLPANFTWNSGYYDVTGTSGVKDIYIWRANTSAVVPRWSAIVKGK